MHIPIIILYEFTLYNICLCIIMFITLCDNNFYATHSEIFITNNYMDLHQHKLISSFLSLNNNDKGERFN